MDAQALLNDVAGSAIGDALIATQWAEEEITAAQHRHPHAQDLLHHAFSLLAPSRNRLHHTEFAYRGHVRELLNRVATGTDTRPATAAEVVVDMLEVATAVPLTPVAEGLLFRMWRAAFPGYEIDVRQHHREQLDGTLIDEEESLVRRKLTRPQRVVGPIECPGSHHGQRVDCAYAGSTPAAS